MRRRLFVLVSVLPFLHFACVDDSVTPPLPDAGAPLYDASLPETSTPAQDAAPDVAVDAGPQPVTVEVLQQGAPVAGVTVVYGDSAGAVLVSGQTDSTGRIARVVPAGSQVTAVLGPAYDARLMTVTAVEPGDVLTVVQPSPAWAQAYVPASLDAIPPSPPTGTAGYGARAGYCDSSLSLGAPVPTSITLYPGQCQLEGRFPMLIRAVNEGGTELGFAFKKGNSGLTDGGAASVSVPAPWVTTLGSHTVGVTNPPVGVTYVEVASSEWADGLRAGMSNYFDATSDASPPSAQFVVHPGYADTLTAEAWTRLSHGNGVSYRILASKAPAAGGTTTFDLSGLLPEITAATVDATTPARPTTTWTASGSLSASDAVFVQMRWSSTFTDGGYGGGTWTIVAPASATSVVAPALPAALSEYLPATAERIRKPPTVAFIEAAFVSNYKQVRSAVATLPPTEELIDDRSYGGVAPELKVDGLLRLSAFTDNGD
jgi:hypothetical protein